MLVEYWPTTWTGPLGPIWDMVHSQNEELEILNTKYKKAIASQKHDDYYHTIRYDTDQIVKIATGIEQTARHHWCDIFTGYARSATGILHLTLHLMIIVLLFCIVLYLFVFY